MNNLSVKAYTVRANDTIDAIAHKYGFHDWRAIYYAPCNAPLRSLRSNPDAIQAGDCILIPLRLTDLKAHNQERLRKLKELRGQVERLFDEQLKELESAYERAQRTASIVDAVKTLIDFGVVAVGAARAAAETIGKRGAALRKLNLEFYKKAREVHKELGKYERDGALEEAVKQHPGENGVGWAIGRIAVNTFLEYDRPSFWAWTYTQLKSGKTWSESVSTTPEDAFRESKASLQRAKADALKRIDKRIWQLKALLRS